MGARAIIGSAAGKTRTRDLSITSTMLYQYATETYDLGVYLASPRLLQLAVVWSDRLPHAKGRPTVRTERRCMPCYHAVQDGETTIVA